MPGIQHVIQQQYVHRVLEVIGCETTRRQTEKRGGKRLAEKKRRARWGSNHQRQILIDESYLSSFNEPATTVAIRLTMTNSCSCCSNNSSTAKTTRWGSNQVEMLRNVSCLFEQIDKHICVRIYTPYEGSEQ